MKKSLFITILFLTVNCFGQNVTEKDTIIKVIYKSKIENNKKPVYQLNGEIVNESISKCINPNEIANVKVEKGDFEIDNVKYFGKVIIETKSNYKPKLISLNNLKAKYTKLKDNPTIFKIDDEIVNADYDTFIVDENYILKITVEDFESKAENLKVNFVNLITKTEENIKKSKEIIIRGKDKFAINK